jgi:hypothetical protein
MKTFIALAFVCSLTTLGVAAPQDPPTGWYIFNGSEQRCEPSQSPADMIRGYQRLQEPVTAHDVTDSFGTLVQTTLTVPIGEQSDQLQLFRDKDRCEAWMKERELIRRWPWSFVATGSL